MQLGRMAHPDFSTIVDIAAPRLIGFLISFVLYVSLIRFTERGSSEASILKCLPMLSLWLFVKESVTEEFNRYRSLIMMGLAFSFSGDVFLNYGLIKPGMVGYAAAIICYISAFGFHPARPWLGIPFYTWGAFTVAVLFNTFSTITKICFPFYCILLMTMCWRAHARIDSPRNILRMASGIGSMLFVLSRFTPFNTPKCAIMGIYYVGQFGIALSVLEREVL